MADRASNKFVLLRQQAEELLENQPDLVSKTPSDILDLIHELQVHQAELEIQNEELKRAQEEISQLHREYEDLYEFAPCSYLTINSKGIITHVNLTGVRLLGNPKTLVMHSGFGGFLAPKWEDLYLAARQKSAETGEKQSIELPLKTENGSPLWVRAEIEARKSEADKAIQWRMVLVDITEQKVADAALRESEARFSAMFEYNTSGVAVYEPIDNGNDFLFKAFNPAAEQITRITKEEVLGNRLLDLFPNMDKTELLDALRRVWRTGRAERLSPFYYKDENREGWRENRVYRLPSDEVVALFDDITARKEAEEALRKSENKLKTLIEAVPDMVWEFDENEVFTFCSQSYKKSLGYEPSELVGKSVYVTMPPNEAETVKKAFEAIKREKKPLIDFLNINLSKDGETRWLRSSAVPIIDDDGNYRGYRGIDRDITDIKEAQREKEELENQLQQARKMEAIGTLAGGIAHEFNNVLGIILGNAELALDDVPHWNPANESLKEIRTASLRAKEVVRQILSFARKTMTALKPLEINTVVKESLKLIRASIPAMVDIRQSIPAEPKIVLGDSTEIHQIVINLCTNAAHAMKQAGGVLEAGISEVALSESDASRYEDLSLGDYVKLTVRDSGEGISPEIMARVFEPYFTTKEFGAGSGMGMAVVYGLVKKCKGAIHLESVVGEGTTVEVLFPKLEEAPAKKTEEYELPVGDERILFVDDDPSIVNMIRQMLERLGYTVSGTTESTEALERFRSAPDDFDLVITDMSMPQMSGDQLAAELMKIRKDMPILLCTGHSDAIDEKKAKELGIKGFAMKPLDKRKLAMAVRAALDK